MQRAKENRNPFLYTIVEEAAPVIDQLRSIERESWTDTSAAWRRRLPSARRRRKRLATARPPAKNT
jgi:hypothetical protein